MCDNRLTSICTSPINEPARRRLDRAAEARSDIEAALKIDARSTYALNALGVIGDTAGQVADRAQAVALDPGLAD